MKKYKEYEENMKKNQRMAEKNTLSDCQIRSTRRILRLWDATDFAELLQ